jgi:glycosyltransferase involved in cell wall biosynthesis
MKVSIITVTYNSNATLKDTIQSVCQQNYTAIEHIVVDGASTDGTLDTIKHYPHLRWISEKDKGLYDAINKGIQMATGDIVGILNSDDFFPQPNIVSTIVEAFKQNNVDAVFGDIAFVKPNNLQKIVRLYSSKKFSPQKFAKGFMPAHPSFYAKRHCFQHLGLYQLDYTIAADYELLMRFIYKHRISYHYIDKILVYMRTGGVSNKNWRSRYILNKEIIKACLQNGVRTNMLLLSFKYINKVFEYIRPAFNSNKK